MTIARAGQRRRLIAVQQHDGTITNGQPTYETAGDWDPVNGLTEVPAYYQGVSGGEILRGMQMQADATGLFRILSTTRTRDIRPRMRIVMDSRTYNILSVIDRDGIQREMWIQTKELADS